MVRVPGASRPRPWQRHAYSGLLRFRGLGTALRQSGAMPDCRHARPRFIANGPIVLGGSIEEGMRAAMGDYMGLAAMIGAPQIPTDAVEKLAPATARAAEPIVSLCLYLCSEDPDIAGMLPKMPARPVHPSPVRVKGGEKTFAADSPRIWGAGWRLGAILRKARAEAKEPATKRGFGRK